MRGRPLWPWERRAAIAWSVGHYPDSRRFREFYRRWNCDGYLVVDVHGVHAIAEEWGAPCQRRGCEHYRSGHMLGPCDWCSCGRFLWPGHDDEPEARV